jgi:hypothetical protein
MPKTRTARPRAAGGKPTPAARKAALTMLRRFAKVRAWKEAVHAEAWRQAIADGSGHCGCDAFEAAGARLEAAGVNRPPKAWFEELQAVLRHLNDERHAPARAAGPDRN